MITKQVSFFAISLSLGLGLTLAFAAKPRKKVGRPQTTQRASVLAGRPMRLADRNPDKPTREQLVKKATLAFQNKPFEGISIQPNLKATGDDLEVQRTIATLLNKADASPPSRLDHFAWLKRPELRQTGWRGLIQSVTPTSGGWYVKVAIRPNLDHMGAMRRIVTSDCFFETYFFDGQNIRYVAGESPPSSAQALMMD
ncbi:hypothetical protein [Singulisphaera acidiphila]|uniref:Uncharacterized protein n=1 Tax=Singulisphaera acidiphila (strain ATCC BAA-1392 / DSM 18658 / VKM B-2454 / MOB10) TaxID=886293 RepID=L0D7V1_SINAD|nr:hypothetical protein [Singulisphaera acidiphila]AGA25484.1 hypothetical protein Sinac_1087 [Singulisphaera acidiphila DSM 18658]